MSKTYNFLRRSIFEHVLNTFENDFPIRVLHLFKKQLGGKPFFFGGDLTYLKRKGQQKKNKSHMYSRVSNNRTQLQVRLNEKESFHSHVEHSN